MFRSSGFRSGNGRPYWMPTRRTVAASTSSAASPTHGPPQRLRAPSDLGWGRTNQACEVVRGDDHGVHSRALELGDLVGGRDREVGDRELAGGDVREQVEHALERVIGVTGLPGREQEDLRVEPFERELQLVRVAHFDDALEAEVMGLAPAALDVLGILLEH